MKHTLLSISLIAFTAGIAGSASAQTVAANDSVFQQYGTKTIGYIYQFGSGNKAKIYQDQASSGVDAPMVVNDTLKPKTPNANIYARISQSGFGGNGLGNNNTAEITQSGNKQYGTITQGGNGHKAAIKQLDKGSRNLTANIEQYK